MKMLHVYAYIWAYVPCVTRIRGARGCAQGWPTHFRPTDECARTFFIFRATRSLVDKGRLEFYCVHLAKYPSCQLSFSLDLLGQVDRAVRPRRPGLRRPLCMLHLIPQGFQLTLSALGFVVCRISPFEDWVWCLRDHQSGH